MIGKHTFVSLCLSTVCITANGQSFKSNSDTLSERSITRLLHADSVSRIEAARIESEINHRKGRIDSLVSHNLPTAVYQRRIDSLSRSLHSKLIYRKKLDSVIDVSIKKLELSGEADSLNQSIKNKLNRFRASQDSAKKAVDHRIAELQGEIRRKESFLDSLNLKWEDPISGKVTGYSAGNFNPAQANQLKVPDLNLGSTKIPNQNLQGVKFELPKNSTPQLNNINGKSQLSTNANLPNVMVPQTEIRKELSQIETEAGKLKAVTQQIESSQKDINMLRQGKLDSIAQVKQVAEREANKLDEVKDLKKNDAAFIQQKNALEQYKDMMASLNTKEVEEKARLVARGELKDQFAGQEARLQAGISELNRLKKKYGQIADSRYLPKRAPNLMKGKPFKERFVLGMNFMIFRNDLFVVDLMPFAMYKLSSHWRAGIGGTYRINFDDHKNQTIGNRDAYGGRAMVDYQFFRGMSAHGEFESINFNPYDPSNLKSLDYVHREWINGAYLGVLKSYRISRQWVGNFQVLYNFLYERNGLYNSKVNIRFGFEFDSNGKKPKFVPAGQ